MQLVIIQLNYINLENYFDLYIFLRTILAQNANASRIRN